MGWNPLNRWTFPVRARERKIPNARMSLLRCNGALFPSARNVLHTLAIGVEPSCGRINVPDLLLLLSVYGSSCEIVATACVADLDPNGIIDVHDLLDLLAQFGMDCGTGQQIG